MKFGDRAYYRQTAEILFDLGRWAVRNGWYITRGRLRARQAVIFAPLGARMLMRLFNPPAPVLFRAKVRPGATLQVSVHEPRRGGKAARGR